MSRDLSRVRALAFDVGGTVFDWHRTIRTEVARLAGERGVEADAGAFAGSWRAGFFAHLYRSQAGDGPHPNADGILRSVVDELAAEHPELELSERDRDDLTRAWHTMAVWPDVPAALPRLRDRYTVVVLTVFSWAIAVDASKQAGLVWDGIVSCEMLDGYKPAPIAYEQGVALLGLDPEEVMMVAAHPIDLHAAAKIGMPTAYVDRPDEWGGGPPAWEPGTTDGIDVVTSDYPELVARLVT